MRPALLLLALAFLFYDLAGNRSTYQAQPEIRTVAAANPTRVDFDTQVKPILQSKCMPCHFNGGQMYARLPFDRPDTIRKLGEKLFTRIKEEPHRRTIRAFLAQQP